jgi:hypothetical protein
MLRFVGSAALPLVSHLFSVDVNPDTLTVLPNQILPNSSVDPALLKNIQLFSFPDASAIESKTFFAFVIGDTACDFHLGFVLFTTSFTGRVLISDFYYPDLFKALLSLPDDQLFVNFQALGRPAVRKEVTLNSRVFPLDGSRERQSLLSYVFSTFCIFDISKIILGMLQARHIYVVSSSAAVVSRLVAALPLLIEPFRWDMNCIPVLPLFLKEATQVPVPTLIGLTQAEVLLEGRVDARVVVNADMRLVIDKPSLDGTHPVRMRAVGIQMDFQRNVLQTLGQFRGCPGFPHKHIQKWIGGFIFQYLRLFTGELPTRQKFIEALATLPEYLESSQVMQDLLHMDRAPTLVHDRLDDWLCAAFKTKSTRPAADRFAVRSASLGGNPSSPSPPPPARDLMLIDFDAPAPVSQGQPEILLDLFSAPPNPPVAPPQADLLDLFGAPPPVRLAAPLPKQPPPKSVSVPAFDSLIDFM